VENFFPQRGKNPPHFSTVWKKSAPFFHSVEKWPQSCSIVWKNRAKFFHSVEKSGRCGPNFSTVWKIVGVWLGIALPATASSLWPALVTPPEAPTPWVVATDFGPLVSRLVDGDDTTRLRAAGPFWEQAAHPNGPTLQATPRPLWVRVADPAHDRAAWDVLWPVASGKTFAAEKSWRVLLAWFWDRDLNDAESQYRFWLLPVWFHGRDEKGAGYAALFPVGGSIHNILLKDRVQFALWPLWIHSQVNDVQTTDVLWPVFSRTTTPDGHIEGRRVFPFYSWNKNARQFEKTAILWPLWTHARYTHPKAEGTAWILFPLVGHINLNNQKGWLVLPPFFAHVQSEQLTRTVILWPFFQRETGVRNKMYVWPFYGYRKDGVLERRFWAWPLVFHEENEWGARKVNRWSVIPFYYHVTQTENPAPRLPTEPGSVLAALAWRKVPPAATTNRTVTAPGRVLATRTKVWPLFSRQADVDAQTLRWRWLDLWPAGQPPAVERSWAPLWTLWDYRAQQDSRDLDVLWGLYRQTSRAEEARAFSLFPLWWHERAARNEARRWAVLKGLLAYDRTATNRQVRVLWLGRIPLKPAPAAAAAEPEP